MEPRHTIALCFLLQGTDQQTETERVISRPHQVPLHQKKAAGWYTPVHLCQGL
jgi:hypothetical protein